MDDSLFKILPPFIPINWGVDNLDQPVRFVLIARRDEAEKDLSFVHLPGSTGVQVILAALIDREQRVLEWLELWLQNPKDAALSPAGLSGLLNQAVIDAEWSRAIATSRLLRPRSSIGTLWDELPTSPRVIDKTRLEVMPLVHSESKKPYVLERDESALKNAGLPPYQKGWDRSFRTTLSNGESKWISLNSASTSASDTVWSDASITTEGNAWIDFNLSGGLMSLQKRPPIGLEIFADWLAAPRSLDASSVNRVLPPNDDPLAALELQILSSLENASSDLERPLSADPELEAWYLRVGLWKKVVASAFRAAVAVNRPFFNLATDSFRLTVESADSLLPTGWGVNVEVVKPSEAIPFSPEQKATHFVPVQPALSAGSLHRFGGWQQGEGTVRFSQLNESDDGVRLEGVLDSPALRDADEKTLIWVQVPLDAQTLQFTAKLEIDQGGSPGGQRFKAFAPPLPANVGTRLKSALARRRPCKLSLVNAVDPALDIHQLGVIGIRILLARDTATVADLEDDIFELAGLLPQNSGIAELRVLAQSPDTAPRILKLLSPVEWSSSPNASKIPVEIWYALIQQLVDFVAVEETPTADLANAADRPWHRPLQNRLKSLDAFLLHLRGVLFSPQVVTEEIGQLVQRFVRRTP